MNQNRIAKFHSPPVFACPLCREPLVFSPPASLRCPASHCFDVAAKGYVDLLPHTGATKYTASLFESRREILEAGFYDGILRDVALSLPLPVDRPLRILDAGCGEGFYDRRLRAVLGEGCEIFALDISRDAIRSAARGGGDIRWMVGDLSRFPLQDNVFDAVLNILSPACYEEFSRVLRPGGLLIKVVPGEDHLRELRALTAPRKKSSAYSNDPVVALLENRFPVSACRRVRETLPVNAAELRHFLAMTPLMFGIETAALDTSGVEHVTVDAYVFVSRQKE